MEDSQSSELEGDSLEAVNVGAIDASSSAATPAEQREKQPPNFKGPSRLVTIILIVILILLLLGGFGFKVTHKTKKQTIQTVTINTQSLDNGTLNKLTVEGANGAEVHQQLTISPSTLFKSDVTVQGTASVQKDLSVGGNISVKGNENLDGTAAIGGGLSVGRNATVGGSLSVSGQITAGSLNVASINLSALNLSGDLAFGGHVIPSGTVPVIRPGNASSGGTAVISGNDTSGTVTITIGNTTLTPGEMAVITFHTPFPLVPKVQLTPDDPEAARLNYYVTQATTFFTVRTADNPTPGAQYIFNYFVTQ